jgi:hypothetical protein
LGNEIPSPYFSRTNALHACHAHPPPIYEARKGILTPLGFRRSPHRYQQSIDGRQTLDRSTFLARYPDIADALAGCLDALEFMHAAGPSLAAVDAVPVLGKSR